MPDRPDGFYWVRWLNGWRPAEYREGEWCVWGVQGIERRRGRAEWRNVEVGPPIVPPDYGPGDGNA